jgi:pimeloyl-ACP methyl ester carboxylesterase
MMVSAAGTSFSVRDDDFTDPWRSHDAVLFMPGFCRTSEFWRGWVPGLARNYRVIRPHPRGTAGSADPGPGYPFTLDTLADDCISLIGALGLERVHFVGESIGGMTGVRVATRHPELIASLTLVSTPVRITRDTQQRNALGNTDWPTALTNMGLGQWWLASRAVVGDTMDDRAADEYFARQIALTPLHVAVALAGLGDGEDISADLDAVSVPTMVLSPGASANTSGDEQAWMAHELRARQHVVVSGATHGMYYKIPDRLVQYLLSFINSI